MDDGLTNSPQTWPNPQAWFEVSFGGRAPIKFLEVDGIPSSAVGDQEEPSRDGPRFTYALPSAKSRQPITLKRGQSDSKTELKRLYKTSMSFEKIETETVRLALVDSEKRELRAWTLNNAWPTKMTGLEFGLMGEDISVEAVELGYEAITLEKG